MNLGVNLVELGEKEAGVKELQDAALRHANHSTVFFNLGWAFLQQERWEESIDASHKSIELQPRQLGAYGNLHAAVRKTGRFAATAKFYQEFLAQHSEVASNHETGARYNAACFAALAAAGQGDGENLPEADRTRWREQAIAWLQAQLTTEVDQLKTGGPDARAALARSLAGWLEDEDLAGIRDSAALAELDASEQTKCREFWGDVRANATRAHESK